MDIKKLVVRGKINFYNGDCQELIEKASNNYWDLAIVDPPYGGEDATNVKSSKSLSSPSIKPKHYAKRNLFEQFENVAPGPEYFAQLERVAKERVIWGFYFMEHCRETGGVLVWDKKGTAFGQAEAAICTMFKSVRIYELVYNGFLKFKGAEGGKRWHSTAKPRRLYEYCLINFAPKNKPVKILDTHGGSMSIARAVYDVNKMEGFDITLDIVEKNKTFFEKGIADFDNHIAQTTLF